MNKRQTRVLLFLVLLIWPIACWSDEREGSSETFLCRGKGSWVSQRDRKGNVLIFVFTKNENYCVGETSDPLNRSCGRYQVFSRENDEGKYEYYLKLIDESGRTMKAPLEIINEYLIVINGKQLRRRE